MSFCDGADLYIVAVGVRGGHFEAVSHPFAEERFAHGALLADAALTRVAADGGDHLQGFGFHAGFRKNFRHLLQSEGGVAFRMRAAVDQKNFHIVNPLKKPVPRKGRANVLVTNRVVLRD